VTPNSALVTDACAAALRPFADAPSTAYSILYCYIYFVLATA
jgi:hypothetical protein